MKPKVERRKYPRIKDKNIAIQLSGDDFDTITQSLDISASGLYCKVPKRIPVMTRVQLALTLPGRTRLSNPVTMNIDGIVVREHPVKKDGKILHHDIAIFFHALLPTERKKLIEYINKKLNLSAKR